ncbi:hypothetical protein ATERTT37_004999 [Aspergillus terreus]
MKHFSNGLPGLATALADRDPILCITSSPPLRDAENNSLQGIIDQVVASRPLTKFAHRMTNPEDTPRIISLAIRTALSGAPGGAGMLGLLRVVGKEAPDLILLLGARTGMYLAGRSGAIIPQKNCTLIHVDVDGAEIGRTLPVELGVISAVDQFVAALNRQFSTGFNGAVDANWVQDALSLRNLPSNFEKDPDSHAHGGLHPYHTVKQVFSAIEPGSIVVLDGGEAGAWAGDLVHLCSPSAILKSTGNLGFLGNGFGYALGAAIAAPDRKVVNLHGDGSAGFHFMELDTYKRFNLNIMTIVVNNYCWGMSSNGQELVYGTKNPARPASSLSRVAEYETVGEGLGNASARVDTISAVQETVKRLQKVDGPSCINLIVDSKPIHPVTTLMVGQTEDPDMVVVPYYDNVPRPYYK